MKPFDALSIPETGRLSDICSDKDALPWSRIRTSLATKEGEFLSQQAPRAAIGVQADNGIETIAVILSIIESGRVPVLFPPSINEGLRDQCLDAIAASGLWTAEGWRNLKGRARLPEGFEIVMYTSGTTGQPKPMAIRLLAMRNNALDVAKFLGLTPGDRHLGTMSHCYMSGLYNATILPLVTGGTALCGPIIDPMRLQAFTQAVENHDPTVVWLNPLVARLLVKLRGVRADLLANVKHVISCTAPLSHQLKGEFEDKFALPILQSYGLSETLITTIEAHDATVKGTAGRPIGTPGSVTVDGDGQIVVQNGALFGGYLEPMPTVGRLPDVSSHPTGDLGHFDAEGNLVITGRLSETINRRGIKLSPERIESGIITIPGVEGCAVVGLDDEVRGSLIIAWIVAPEKEMDQLHTALRKSLDAIEVPDVIRLVETLPLTASGKVDRAALRTRI